ncbi:MAG: hypothetical protein ABJG28_02620, partial [Nonlabens ulvanivorans]|uniref:hypothetical protein n=1 Tax=Nonlabens ulvanivorans TaxID=906888 RepID=UPI003267EF8F
FEQSFFNQRFVSKLTNHTSIHLIKEGDDKASEELFVVANNEVNQDVTEYPLDKKLKHEMGCLTEEQLVAVKHVMQVVKGHRNRPLILTADRGRGKSSALAIACAELLMTTHEGINIAITAPHKNSLDVFFAQMRSSLKLNGVTEKANNTTHQLEHKNGTIEFIAIDELIKTPTRFNLVLVDEAASIPLFFLNQLLTKFHRMVFASTVHGYEGAGRSFTLKFQKHIKKQYPQGKTFNIKQPIRWADNDPVEAFINDLCLLDAEPPVLSEDVSLPHVVDRKDTLYQPSLFVFKQVTTEQLIADEVLLKQVFAVLVTAHYQTSPNDLRLLLDNENISLVTLSFKEQLLGVALLLKEGASKNEHIKSLLQTNQRRLKDQFLPQSLLTHCGEENSFNFSY